MKKRYFSFILLGCLGVMTASAQENFLIEQSKHHVPIDKKLGVIQMQQTAFFDHTKLQMTFVDRADIHIQKQGNRLIISSLTQSIHEQLAGKLSGVGLIESIENTPKGLGFVSTVVVSQPFEYRVHQTADQISIEIFPVLEPKVEYHGKRITLEFQDVPIRAALEALANFSGINIVADDSVAGNITTRLVNIPWDQALSVILQSKRLNMYQENGVLFISSLIPSSDAPLKTEYIRLKYASAVDVQSLIVGEKISKINESTSNVRVNNSNKIQSSPSTQQKQTQTVLTQTESTQLLSQRGTVAVDRRTNTLIVQDVEHSLSNIRRLIEQIDVPVRQVMIQARIVSANENFGRELGVSLGARADYNRWQLGGSHQTLWQMRKGETQHTSNDLNVNLAASNPVGRVAFGLLNLSGAILDLELSAMQAENRGEIIATPKVLTADKQMARISSGVQIPYQEATSSGATSTSFKEASLILEATPNITSDGKIMLKLNIKNGVPTTNLGNVAIQEEAIETNVIVENGQTVVLGGIYRESNLSGVQKVPFLGDIPVLGKLFSSQKRQQEKSELLIFITPMILPQ